MTVSGNNEKIKIIRRTIAKETVASLPVVDYNGEIILIDSKEKAYEAIEILKRKRILGIDTETRPSFRRGERYKVALLQISTDKQCFLFRLNKIGFLPELKALLENRNIKKIGLSIRDDFRMLNYRSKFRPHNVVELQDYVRPFGVEEKSLQKIYAVLFNEKISKSQRLTNWEAAELTPGQQKYAAIDAWSCVKIYKYLEKLKKTGLFEKEQIETQQEHKEGK